jgi:hypothetical protein
MVGCTSGTDGEASATSESSGERPVGATSPGADQLEVLEDSPFAQYMPVIVELLSLPEYTSAQEAEIRARDTAISEFIAGCMRERGFDYFWDEWEPDEPSAAAVFFADGVDLIPVNRLPGSIDRVRAEGYGLQSPTGGSESGAETSGASLANEEYRSSLSVGSRSAYDLALTGQDYEKEPDPAIPPGCGALAIEEYPEVETTAPSTRQRFWAEFGPLVLGMNTVVLEDAFQDQRVRDLSLGWYDCMAEAGYDELTAGWRYSTENVTINAGVELAMTTLPDGETGWYWYDIGSQDTPDGQRSLVGSEAEIAIAVADFECRQPLDYFGTHRAVQLELEQEYVDDNQAAFDGLLAVYESYRAEGPDS